MKYRNTKTGTVIETKAKIAGGDWVPVGTPTTEKPKTTKKEKVNG